MPLYEYRCAKCGRTFEKIQKFSNRPSAKCAECGGKGKRLLSAPAIHFKGTGWYVTDYGRKGKPNAEKGSDQPSDDSKPSKSDKKDSKKAGKKSQS